MMHSSTGKAPSRRSPGRWRRRCPADPQDWEGPSDSPLSPYENSVDIRSTARELRLTRRVRFPLDQGHSSKIRALTLASRTLTREIRRLKDSTEPSAQEGDAAVEIDRLVKLARTILDPGYFESSKHARAHEGTSGPRAPLPSGRANGAKAADLNSRTDDFQDLAGDGPPGPDHVLAFLGRGTLVPIPELVGFLGSLGVSGILRVSSSREEFLVEFADGQISHAEGSGSPPGHRLGDLLIVHGAIDRLSLETGVSDIPGWKLGRRLVQEKLITEEQLVRALQAQIQLLFCRLFREKAKSYTFWSGPSIWGEQGVRLNATTLLLEGARACDEVGDERRALDGASLSEID